MTNFKKEVIENSLVRPTMVMYTADWCGPCKTMKPMIHAMADQRDDIDVVMLDVQGEPAISAQYGIRAIPTFMMFRDGDPISHVKGMQTFAALTNWINSNIT